jgi:hypothetical protein
MFDFFLLGCVGRRLSVALALAMRRSRRVIKTSLWRLLSLRHSRSRATAPPPLDLFHTTTTLDSTHTHTRARTEEEGEEQLLLNEAFPPFVLFLSLLSASAA